MRFPDVLSGRISDIFSDICTGMYPDRPAADCRPTSRELLQYMYYEDLDRRTIVAIADTVLSINRQYRCTHTIECSLNQIRDTYRRISIEFRVYTALHQVLHQKDECPIVPRGGAAQQVEQAGVACSPECTGRGGTGSLVQTERTKRRRGGPGSWFVAPSVDRSLHPGQSTRLRDGGVRACSAASSCSVLRPSRTAPNFGPHGLQSR
eukprot:COSAG02_NODE_1997_length_10152_cov_3.110315_8_plen_207_part_00